MVDLSKVEKAATIDSFSVTPPATFLAVWVLKFKSAFLPSHFSRAFHVRTMTRHPIGTMMDGHHHTHPRTTAVYQSMVYDV
jgi:hypothetical protein